MSVTADRNGTPSEVGSFGFLMAGGRFVVSHRRPIAFLVVGVLFAILVGTGMRWWTHPNLFRDDGPDITGTNPLDRAQLTIGVVQPIGGLGDGHDPTPHTITFTGPPEVQMAQNTARATVSLSVCTRNPRRQPLIAVVNGPANRYCDTLTPIRDRITMPWPTLGTYIVATLTPHQAGRVRLTGLDFHYCLGRDHWYQRGVDHVTLDVRQKVSARSG